jgi:hypothetical protein
MYHQMKQEDRSAKEWWSLSDRQLVAMMVAL